METTKTTKTTKSGEKIRTLRKVSVEIVKLSKKETGEFVEGTYTGRSTGPYIDKTTGEETELVRLQFTRDDGSKFIIFEDGGLRNAMANAMVKEGDWIRIVKMDQVEIGNGRRSNQYDIFTAEN